jgi:hypothetical protein
MTQGRDPGVVGEPLDPLGDTLVHRDGRSRRDLPLHPGEDGLSLGTGRPASSRRPGVCRRLHQILRAHLSPVQ